MKFFTIFLVVFISLISCNIKKDKQVVKKPMVYIETLLNGNYADGNGTIIKR